MWKNASIFTLSLFQFYKNLLQILNYQLILIVVLTRNNYHLTIQNLLIQIILRMKIKIIIKHLLLINNIMAKDNKIKKIEIKIIEYFTIIEN